MDTRYGYASACRMYCSGHQPGDNYFQVTICANSTRIHTFREHLQGLERISPGRRGMALHNVRHGILRLKRHSFHNQRGQPTLASAYLLEIIQTQTIFIY